MGQCEESVPVGPVGKFLNHSAAETGGNKKLRPLYLGGRNFSSYMTFALVFFIMNGWASEIVPSGKPPA